ncbi:MAG: FAD-dependent oxidoreductase, partial [Candidatus Omnitrophica bacterium]|nr:FAD-dependent oxidoreductase [Candidatus Omnitrophota bacterium]
YNLIKKKKSVLLIDNRHHTSSSTMSAGIINPITGKRFILTEDFAKFHHEAELTYRELENKLNTTFYAEKKIVRFYSSSQEHKIWSERKDTINSSLYIKGYNPSGLFSRWFDDRYGSLTVKGYVCDVSVPIKKFSDILDKNQILPELFEFNHLKINQESVTYKNMSASKIIFCEGYLAETNPYFKFLPFKPAKGDILTLSVDDPLPDKIFNFGKWVMPIDDKTVKTGSTFYWNDLDPTPTAEGKNEILNALKNMAKFSIKVINHQTGIRPVILDLVPVLGLHPEYNAIGIFNGLGAKGVLYAPWLARHLADHLVDESPLDRNININRFSV